MRPGGLPRDLHRDAASGSRLMWLGPGDRDAAGSPARRPAAARRRLVAENPPDFFREPFRKGLPSSIDELEWESPILTAVWNWPTRRH